MNGGYGATLELVRHEPADGWNQTTAEHAETGHEGVLHGYNTDRFWTRKRTIQYYLTLEARFTNSFVLKD
jgi:hypothetical protein